MKNEPKEIFLYCYDERETNPEYLPKDNDFQSLDVEFVNWGETKNEGCYDVKYVHHSVVDGLLEALIKMRDTFKWETQEECDAWRNANAAITKALCH